MDLDKKILEELIYERVRVSVNLCQLVLFEQDLDRSIERVMARCGTGEQNQLTRAYMEKAWQRLEREWETMRERLDVEGSHPLGEEAG